MPTDSIRHRLLVSFALLVAGQVAVEPVQASDVSFSRDIQPILSGNCYQCHGPAEEGRSADLRLDQFRSTDHASGAEMVVTPGAAEESELIARVTSDDEDMVMPPPHTGKSLKPDEVEKLRKWIDSGAQYEEHWAFTAPVRPTPPQVSLNPAEKPAKPKAAGKSWVRNPIDAFVLRRLQVEGLEPSPEADRETLLRRLSLDLTGLPPTLTELDTAGSYESEVERLLTSPHFGEHWGRYWLDAARYADSDGFEKDKPREVWMYRDWVIDSLNKNKPYSDFVIEQIAGDLLEEPSQEQLVATGFLRNSMINEEGGADPEQFRMEAMFDRMDAIGKSVLGLTLQCAQCHSHKYDPLTHTDYYRMFALLNNCDEGQASVYTEAERRQWRATKAIIEDVEEEIKLRNADWEERLAAWEAAQKEPTTEWHILRPKLDGSGAQKHYLLEDGSVLAQGYAPTKHAPVFEAEARLPSISAIRLELLNDPNLPHEGPGRSIYGLCALSEFRVSAKPLGSDKKAEKYKVKTATADVNPAEAPLQAVFDDRSKDRRVTGPIEFALDNDNKTAWGIDIGPGRSNVPRQAVFVLEKPIESAEASELFVTLSQHHGGWNSDDFQSNNLGRFRLSVAAEPAEADPVPRSIRKILRTAKEERCQEQCDELFSYWRTTVDEWAVANQRIEKLWRSHPKGVSQLVLLAKEEPRKTHRLDRGDFLSPKEEVSTGVPSFLHPIEEETPNRLDFAEWLVDRNSPTTARAVVNRIWQAYFGTGLVPTPDDLGTQSEPPSHPELLDWLAVELMESGWRLKHIHELIVDSATYRQASVLTPALLEKDPQNRLLARGTRRRVDAEVVRDIALSTSGLINTKIGGPSVYPPAPKFLFKPPASYGPKRWDYDLGPDKYRRAMYAFHFRSVPYPALQVFDAPNRNVSCVRRVRSNTPLQALTTLNEPLFLECAQALAVRALTHPQTEGQSTTTQLEFAVRCCLGREASNEEVATLHSFLVDQHQRFASGDLKAQDLLSDSQRKALPDADPNYLAAWTATARVLLNLDETITRE